MAVVGTELALAVLAILATRWVDSPEVITAGAKTVPGIWPAAAVVAWSVLRGWRGGLLAAAVVAAADLVEVADPTENTVNNIILLLLLGGCVGYCADLSREGHAALREAIRLQAQVRERDRLARTVHDGVLQTLSYIHRRGTDMGGETRELAAMAAEQERLLRTLVSDVSTPPPEPGGRGRGGPAHRPRAPCRGRRAGGRPGRPGDARAPGGRGAGAPRSARCWTTCAGTPGTGPAPGCSSRTTTRDVVVTVRDDGVGVAPGRLAEAAAAGRMGVTHSIHGRINDLGGRAVYDSRAGGGTTVELMLPRRGRRMTTDQQGACGT